jgi:hypothetical protein
MRLVSGWQSHQLGIYAVHKGRRLAMLATDGSTSRGVTRRAETDVPITSNPVDSGVETAAGVLNTPINRSRWPEEPRGGIVGWWRIARGKTTDSSLGRSWG